MCSYMCKAVVCFLLGTYHVILDESHYKELLTHHVSPPPASSSSECSLIRMGMCLFCYFKNTYFYSYEAFCFHLLKLL